MEIKQIIKNLITKHHTDDPVVLAGCLNVDILFSKYLKKTLAYHFHELRHSFIVINSHAPDHLFKYLVAHELAHVILHRHINTIFLKSYTFLSIAKIETEADTFAAELLIPDDLLVEYQQFTLQQIATLQGVPLEVAKLKKFPK